MGKVAIIPCDNGLGHLRRCYLLGLKFANNNHNVTILAPVSKFKLFQNLFGVNKNLKNINFSAGGQKAESAKWSAPMTNWINQLPDLRKYHLVISDNLPEILVIRPDAVLSGHFFWHDIYPNIHSYYGELCNDLIEKYKPMVVGTYLFSSKAVKNCKNYKPTGIYISGETDFDQRGKDSILISGGSTSIIRDKLIKTFEDIVSDQRFSRYNLYIDHQLLANSKITSKISLSGSAINANDNAYRNSHNIFIAEYNEFMYKKIDIALCRPGIGTISDLLQYGCYPICFNEFENKEMQDNISCLKSFGLGSSLDIFSSNDTLLKCITSISDNKNSFLKQLSNQNFNGADITYNLLEKKYKW
jgi:hypothetical protein